MRKIQWTHITIQNNNAAEHMRQLFLSTTQTAAAFDTETDGLNILRCKPFLYQFGWYDEQTMQGYTFVVDLETTPQLARQVIKVWHALVKRAPINLGANVKYDLHMLTNIDLSYREDNISDLQMWIRLGTDAIPERFGGAPLALKEFAAKYIDASARDHEKLIKEERTQIAKELNLKLRRRLGWRAKDVEDFFKDPVHDASDLPEDKRKAYEDWHTHDLPLYLQPQVLGAVDSDMIGYQTLNRYNVIEYGHFDIVWVLEAYHILKEAVRVRENMDAIKMEEANIYPVYDMERVGFTAGKEYLYECRRNVKQYILERREDMFRVAGKQFTIGQREVIKQILDSLGVHVESTGAEELDVLVPKLKHKGNFEAAVEFIEVLQELRTLEKWYSTYINKFLVDLKYSDILCTQVNLSGAVSLRVTCDFQQFPKGAIKTVDGRELFKPRKLFIVPPEYKGIIYLDYSQIELRLQAMYTVLVGNGEGDLNLCRAYMPYKCYTRDASGKIPFDCSNWLHLQCAYSWEWYRNEDDTVWTPTDVHGATTKHAFNIDEDDEKWLIKQKIILDDTQRELAKYNPTLKTMQMLILSAFKSNKYLKQRLLNYLYRMNSVRFLVCFTKKCPNFNLTNPCNIVA
jgi:DNA polymerase I-like protein with 3'-5' exonuclease and polymerase domains